MKDKNFKINVEPRGVSRQKKRKLVEEAAERLAEILITQVELSRLNSKENTTNPSQQNYDNRDQKFKKMPEI